MYSDISCLFEDLNFAPQPCHIPSPRKNLLEFAVSQWGSVVHWWWWDWFSTDCRLACLHLSSSPRRKESSGRMLAKLKSINPAFASQALCSNHFTSPQASPNCGQLGDQVFTYMSLLVTVHIQTLTYSHSTEGPGLCGHACVGVPWLHACICHHLFLMALFRIK